MSSQKNGTTNPAESSPDTYPNNAQAAAGETASAATPAPAAPMAAEPTAVVHEKSGGKHWAVWLVLALALGAALYFGIPWVHKSLSTVSTDDAYVNGHVTFVAPRISGQVTRVLVDDNNRVHKGSLLVQLDKEPYQILVNIAQASVDAANADLIVARAQARATTGRLRSLRFALQHAIENVSNQLALLHSKVAFLNSQKATLIRASMDYERAVPLVKENAVSQEVVDHRKQEMLVAQAQVEEALQGVYQVRVSLGLPPKPENGHLTEAPPDLDQTFSEVRQAQASLIQAAAELGITDSFNKTPKQMVADFYKRDPSGDIDKIYALLLKDAPIVKQAEAKLTQTERALDQAKLNLSYCDVVAEVDGVVTRRNVNPGNNVLSGQSVMALRSVTDIWIDANFKETQLADLRIGQSVDLDVDMYGAKKEFKGRIAGFTMGTGSTLALLPAENATGNFVKVVQRLPVRIDLIDYDADKTPLFIGLSVTPVVRIKEAVSGPDAGKVLQPYAPTSTQESKP